MDFNTIQQIDLSVLHFFNGSNNLMMDHIVVLLTSGWTWSLLYLMLFYVVIRNNESMKQIGLIVGAALLCVLIADGITDGLVKPLVERPRPCNDETIKYTIQVVDNLRPSGFSFFSAHAANTMSIAIFFSLLIRSRMISVTLVLWSLLNCWTRLYLGVHYPSDILCGLVCGALTGVTVYYFIYRKTYRKISPNIQYVSNQYTQTGYEYEDLDMVMSVVMLTFMYVLVRAAISTYYI